MPQRIGQSHQAGRDLQVEEIARDAPRPQPAETHLFSPGVDDHLVGGINDQLPERVERSHGQRINEDQPFVGCDLNEAESWMVGIFADEFRVKAKLPLPCEIFTTGG